MIHAKATPSALTADNMQLITAAGCSLPMADVIRFPTMDHFEMVQDALISDGVSLELIPDNEATPSRMTEKEVMLLVGWYRNQRIEGGTD